MLDSDPYRNSRQIRKTGIEMKETEWFWGEKGLKREDHRKKKKPFYAVKT
jgi:hypothetical protein